jgi:hypothetical protein
MQLVQKGIVRLNLRQKVGYNLSLPRIEMAKA